MRIALGISYQGTCYYGWQTQRELQTLQFILEQAIARVAAHPIRLICAGRTDKGVHALGQVAHFDSTAIRNERAWLLGINSHLPADIRIRWVRKVSDRFHARFSALARQYRYIINNDPFPSALWNNFSTHVYFHLEEGRMQMAAHYLIGEHDFSSFRAVGCQSKTAVRHIYALKLARQGDYVILDIIANAFLHHMVRNIVGVLLSIGGGQREPIWVKDVLLARDRKKAGITAHPNGLYLAKVFYSSLYSIPSQGVNDPFLALNISI